MQPDQAGGGGAATRQITLRMDRALHNRLKHALTERDIKFQPLVVWLIEFWLDHPDFQVAATDLAKTPIGKTGRVAYSSQNATTEIQRFAEIFARIPGGVMVQRKAIEFLEAALALHESAAVTKGNEQAALNQITQQAISLAKQVESFRSAFGHGGKPLDLAAPPKKRRSAETRGGAAGSRTQKEAPWEEG